MQNFANVTRHFIHLSINNHFQNKHRMHSKKHAIEMQTIDNIKSPIQFCKLNYSIKPRFKIDSCQARCYIATSIDIFVTRFLTVNSWNALQKSRFSCGTLTNKLEITKLRDKQSWVPRKLILTHSIRGFCRWKHKKNDISHFGKEDCVKNKKKINLGFFFLIYFDCITKQSFVN